MLGAEKQNKWSSGLSKVGEKNCGRKRERNKG